jgi:hypothetical protein
VRLWSSSAPRRLSRSPNLDSLLAGSGTTAFTVVSARTGRSGWRHSDHQGSSCGGDRRGLCAGATEATLHRQPSVLNPAGPALHSARSAFQGWISHNCLRPPAVVRPCDRIGDVALVGIRYDSRGSPLARSAQQRAFPTRAADARFVTNSLGKFVGRGVRWVRSGGRLRWGSRRVAETRGSRRARGRGRRLQGGVVRWRCAFPRLCRFRGRSGGRRSPRGSRSRRCERRLGRPPLRRYNRAEDLGVRVWRARASIARRRHQSWAAWSRCRVALVVWRHEATSIASAQTGSSPRSAVIIPMPRGTNTPVERPA